MNESGENDLSTNATERYYGMTPSDNIDFYFVLFFLIIIIFLLFFFFSNGLKIFHEWSGCGRYQIGAFTVGPLGPFDAFPSGIAPLFFFSSSFFFFFLGVFSN